jgi:hypothetical protein
MSFRGTQWYVSHCLAGELIGLEAVDDDRWAAHVGPIPLGVLDLVRRGRAGIVTSASSCARMATSPHVGADTRHDAETDTNAARGGRPSPEMVGLSSSPSTVRCAARPARALDGSGRQAASH